MIERGDQPKNDGVTLNERQMGQIEAALARNPDNVPPHLLEIYNRQKAKEKPQSDVSVSETTPKVEEGLPGLRESLNRVTSNPLVAAEAEKILNEAVENREVSPPIIETHTEQTESEEEVEEITRDEIIENLEIALSKVPRDSDPEKDKKMEEIREAKKLLKKEGIDVDNYIGKGRPANDQEKVERGKRKAYLRNLVVKVKDGHLTQDEANILTMTGLNIDSMGIRIEEDVVVVPQERTETNRPERRQRVVPVEDEDMPSFGERAPRNELELRQKFREVIRDYLKDAQDENSLGIDRIKTKIKYTFGGVEFDRLCKDVSGGDDEVKSRIETEVNAEIEARANLRRAQLREMEYVSMTDKAKAIERFINDNQEGSGGRKSALIALSTYKWLQSLGGGEINNQGEKLTTQNVDRAFAAMVMMGEEKPDFSSEWMKEFGVYRPYIIEGGQQKFVDNMYWPSYFSSKRDSFPAEYVERVKNLFPGVEFSDISADMMLDSFYVKLSQKFGDDSVTLAKQLFDGYKERGNYDWQHYMAGLFTFASSRDAVAMNVMPPGYTGSNRPYVERFNVNGETYSISEVKKLNYDGLMSDEEAKRIVNEIKSRQTGDGVEVALTYDKQIRRLAISPLRVKKLESTSQNVYSNDVVREPRLLLRRAMAGRLIQDTKWEDRGTLMKYLPQIDSLNTTKLGVKVRTAIDSIGALSEAADKSAKIGEAVGALATLREKGDSLVDYGALTSEDVDKQILIEATNVLWELGVNNELNTQDLEIQSISKPNFLTPALVNALYARLGGSTSTGLKIMGKNSSNYARLNGYTSRLRRRTLDLMKRMAIVDTSGEANKVVLAQEREMQKDLPTEYGVGVKTSTQRAMERDAENINRTFDTLEKFFPWMKRK